MFAYKKKYFLIIETIKNINLRKIKKNNKFIIIYRNKNKKDDIYKITRFIKKCKVKGIKFFVANDLKLAILVKSDGVYLSAHNRDLRALSFKKEKFEIIGSAHNTKEISLKKKQGCKFILLARLFKVSYKPEMSSLGVNKFNFYSRDIHKILIPLGGIKVSNLNKLKTINSVGFAIMSELKKKPTEIISRLF